MCDYSLEMYKNRAAVDDEELVTRRFPSGSQGFVSEADADCAVCCKSGVEMTLDLSGTFPTVALGNLLDPHEELFVGPTAVAFFSLPSPSYATYSGGAVYRDGYTHRDGFIVPSGRFLSIQKLPVGTRARVTKALPPEIAKAATEFDADIKLEMVSDYAPAPAPANA